MGLNCVIPDEVQTTAMWEIKAVSAFPGQHLGLLISRPKVSLRSSRIRVDLLLYESKPTDKRLKYDWMAGKKIGRDCTMILFRRTLDLLTLRSLSRAFF